MGSLVVQKNSKGASGTPTTFTAPFREIERERELSLFSARERGRVALPHSGVVWRGEWRGVRE
jgi:hypothetical protein